MSRIEVQRSNSRNKIIAITIAISPRTMKPRKSEGERDRSGDEKREVRDGTVMVVTATESSTTKYVNVVLTPPSHAPSASRQCRREFVVEASGITQMRLFSERNVHPATKLLAFSHVRN